jgi:hypothetical protein
MIDFDITDLDVLRHRQCGKQANKKRTSKSDIQLVHFTVPEWEMAWSCILPPNPWNDDGGYARKAERACDFGRNAVKR